MAVAMGVSDTQVVTFRGADNLLNLSIALSFNPSLQIVRVILMWLVTYDIS